jgi:hypothetical protein
VISFFLPLFINVADADHPVQRSLSEQINSEMSTEIWFSLSPQHTRASAGTRFELIVVPWRQGTSELPVEGAGQRGRAPLGDEFGTPSYCGPESTNYSFFLKVNIRCRLEEA